MRDLDPQNDLRFLRVRSRDHEMMVHADPEFTLIARETVKDALRDRDVHRAALEGAMGNLSVKLNPFRRSNEDAASPRGRADSESGARSPPPPA